VIPQSLLFLIVLAAAPVETPPPPAPDDPSSQTPATAPSDPTASTGIPALEAPRDSLGEALRPDPQGLTSSAVAKRAVEVAPRVQASDAAVEIAAAQVDQTIVSYLPRFGASASYTRLSDVNVQFGSGALVGATNPGLLTTGACPGGGPGVCVLDAGGAPVGAASFEIPQVLNQFSTQASLSVPVSDYVLRIFSGLKAANKNEDAARLSKEAEIRKVAIDARVVYYNWLRAVTQVAIAKDALRTSEARLRDAEVGYRVGVVTEADRLRIEALVAQASRLLSEGEAFERVTRESLAVIMDEPVREYRVGEDLLSAAPTPRELPELEALVAQALQNRPELASLATTVEALDAGIRSERAGYAPRLEGFADVTYANPNPRFFPPTDEWNATWSAGARLAWTINQPLATRMRNKELKAQSRNLDAQYHALQRGIHLEVASAYAERKNAIAAIGYTRIAREANEAAYRAVSAQFKVGRTTATDVIVVLQDLFNAQLQDINARIDLRVAEAKLDYAIGSGWPEGSS